MRINTLFALFIVFLLLAGCTDIFWPPKPPDGTGNNGTTVTPTENKTTGVVITGSENFTAAEDTKTEEKKNEEAQKDVQSAANYISSPNEQIFVYFIDVSKGDVQADSILIKKGDADILIDAGPASSGQTIVEFLKARGVDDIELLILTHADPEHYGGVEKVMDNYLIGNVLWSGRTYEDAAFQALLDKLTAKQIPLKTAMRGNIETINNINLNELNPVEKTFAAVDEDAIVFKITDRKFCLLLPSDALGGGLDDITKKTDVKCSIMELPRGGSDQLGVWINNVLDAAAPKDAIISGAYKESVDKTDFRNPLFGLLESKGVGHYETYKGGSIRIVSDGDLYNISYVK